MNTIILDVSRCKGCGICADCCPKKVFDHAYLGAKPSAARQSDCVGCGSCVLRCPDFAIRLEKK